MDKIPVMTIDTMKNLFSQLSNDGYKNYQIWLSSDEEGNEFMPMLNRIELSIGIDNDHKRIVLFPSHPYDIE